MKNQSYRFDITWYGHCCYKITYGNISFLIDPYDTFQGIYLGFIDSDYLLSSSSWHDHGHIGASPKSHVLTYPGKYDFQKGFIVYGIKTSESRGSQNTIFSVHFDDGFSFTNFADWGDEQGYERLTASDKAILTLSKVIFVRINSINENTDLYCYDLALQTCIPKVIFPEHYYPESFVMDNLPINKRQGYLDKMRLVERMKSHIGYPVKEIDDFHASIVFDDPTKQFVELKSIHPQVTVTEQI